MSPFEHCICTAMWTTGHRHTEACNEMRTLRAENERLRKELSALRGDDNAWSIHAELRTTRAEVEALREALEQVLVDINDPHPRTATLGGYRDALMATEKMVRAVLLKGAP